MNDFKAKLLTFVRNYYFHIIFFIALFPVFGSLYYSEIVRIPPCTLCWYQRIFMYPILIITGAVLSLKEKLSYKIILALALPGMLIALYHYFMQKTGIGSEFANCTAGVSCSTIEVEYLGFITLPLMSFFAFLALALVSILYAYAQRKSEM